MVNKIQIWLAELKTYGAKNVLASFTAPCGCSCDVVFHLWSKRTKKAGELKRLEWLAPEECGDCKILEFLDDMATSLGVYVGDQ